jgi:hypothetical protein
MLPFGDLCTSFVSATSTIDDAEDDAQTDTSDERWLGAAAPACVVART